ncbi:cytochrome P450 monooxygenase [Xylaria intraflava]|nr:cytochrome P450 monooxygenase [Xylaria intraflava]
MNETLSSPFGFPSWEGDWNPRALLSIHLAPYLLGIIMIAITKYTWATTDSNLKKLPSVNPAGFFSMARAQQEFVHSANELLQKARDLYPNRPYRMTTDSGDAVVLQSEAMEEIRNSPGLSFFGTFAQERICEVPGFEPLAALGVNGELIQIVTRKWLTRSLDQVTSPLSEETSFALKTILGESTEWREATITPMSYDLTSRISSRVFLGQELSRNEDWLRIAKGYTASILTGNNKLREYPVHLRPYIGRLPLIPECGRAREYYTRAKKLIGSVMKEREEMRQAAKLAGQPAPIFNDALEWINQESKARNLKYDPATFQMILSFVAIGTTTDALHTTLTDLIQHPEALQAVREEIIHVLRAQGWKKSSLYHMKLLDSVIKESQRIKPVFSAMRRSVDVETRLSDGTVLKKGSRIYIDTHRMLDPAVYENPAEWKADRYLELRSHPGKEHMAQLVATSTDHMGFGHGEHACPGRFFAATQLKIALCHMLINYDWKLAPGTDIKFVEIGFRQRANPATKVLYRKREALNFDIDSVEGGITATL